MDDHELDFRRLIFITVLGMQYHPRNEVFPDQDMAVIVRCADIAHKAAAMFNTTLVVSDDVPF